MKTITFRHNEENLTANVGMPLREVPRADQLVVRVDGVTYAIALDFSTGGFIARPWGKGAQT